MARVAWELRLNFVLTFESSPSNEAMAREELIKSLVSKRAVNVGMRVNHSAVCTRRWLRLRWQPCGQANTGTVRILCITRFSQKISQSLWHSLASKNTRLSFKAVYIGRPLLRSTFTMLATSVTHMWRPDFLLEPGVLYYVLRLRPVAVSRPGISPDIQCAEIGLLSAAFWQGGTCVASSRFYHLIMAI